MEPDASVALELADFITRGPSSFHAAAEAGRRLSAAGFPAAAGTPGDDSARGHLVRDGSVLAWYVPDTVNDSTPVRIVAAHTDSPTFKVKPRPDAGAAGWLQAGVEVYGSPLFNSWLDRDLGLAGRLALLDGSTVLVNVDRPLLRIPQLAPHMDRGVNQRGLTLDPQRHLLPVWGTGQPRAGELIEFLAATAGVEPGQVAGHDLVLHELTAPALLGQHRELLAAPRLDNLSSTYCALAGFLAAAADGPGDVILIYAAFDHEEVGSGTATGAAGPLLETVLRQVWPAWARGPLPGSPAMAASLCLSADAANGVHPNYLEYHDPDHRALPGAGPVLKFHAAQRYGTDAIGAAAWERACRQADVPVQVFASRNNIQCGTTIGPLIATRTGIRTIDVGMPVLSMHSARELCGTADAGYLAAAATAFLAPA
jgi:aspartyl aminopeptidase